ncbi:MAG: hypothetical protein C4B58_15015, partial [Deltaproteobacteria bacterium]
VRQNFAKVSNKKRNLSKSSYNVSYVLLIRRKTKAAAHTEPQIGGFRSGTNYEGNPIWKGASEQIVASRTEESPIGRESLPEQKEICASPYREVLFLPCR